MLMRKLMDFSAVLFLLACLGFSACSGRPESADAWASDLVKSRKERDLAFQSDQDSPIPEANRSRFAGLDYYPPNPDLRFRVKLHRYPRPEPIRMTTNKGDVRSGLRYGFFAISIRGVSVNLRVYRLDDDATNGNASLFVPFLDATAGKETYSGGRYLDFAENTSGMYDLDFNLAYNPYCAYGGDFSCPVPPEENRMPVAIHAGEKIYPIARK